MISHVRYACNGMEPKKNMFVYMYLWLYTLVLIIFDIYKYKFYCIYYLIRSLQQAVMDENKPVKQNEDNLEEIIDKQTTRLQELDMATVLIKSIITLFVALS